MRRLVVVVLVLAVCWLGDRGAWLPLRAGAQIASRSGQRPDTAAVHLVDSLRTQFAARLAPGARAVVSSRPAGDFWEQRIAEAAVLAGIVLVGRAGDADFAIWVSAPPGTAAGRLLVAVGPLW